MKKIKPRRRRLRINSPLSFGVLCALILLLIGGAAYGLAAGVIAPAVDAYQEAHATPTQAPTPSPEVVTPPPETATPDQSVTPDPNASIDPNATVDPNASIDPNATPGPVTTAEQTGRLEGRIIAIDAAKSKGSQYDGVSTGVDEYRINMAYADAVRELLEAEGATVIMTRADNDTVVDPSVRIRTVNDSDAEIALSIMCNYIDASGTRGTQMIVPKNHDERTACDNLATCVLNAYVEATGMPTREVNGETVRHLTTWPVLNGIEKPVAAIVLGHISNRTDDQNLNDADFMARGAQGIVDGIIAYFQNN